jgi:hypothetical protein
VQNMAGHGSAVIIRQPEKRDKTGDKRKHPALRVNIEEQIEQLDYGCLSERLER